MSAWALVLLLASPVPRDGALEASLAEQIRRGDVPLALRAADGVVAAREKALGARSLALATELDALADQVSALDAAAAKDWAGQKLRRSLALQEQLRGPADAGQAATLARLSDLCFGQGEWACSEKYDRRLLAIRRRTLAANHPDVADSNRNVGLSLFWQARLAEARPFLDESVRLLEQADPPLPLKLAEALESQAENLRAQNRYGEAEAIFARALALAEAAAGPRDPALVPILINMSGLFRDTNRLAEAHWRTRQALEIEEAAAAPKRMLLITLWNNLAELLRVEGDAAGAEQFYRKTLDAARDVLGPDHPYVGTYLSQMAVLLSEQRRFGEAEAAYGAALAIKVKASGPGHPDVAQTRYDLGRLFLAWGRYGDATRELQQALAIREKALGPRHPDVAVSLIGLVEAEQAEGGSVRTMHAHLDRALRILQATPAEARAQAAALGLRARIRYAAGARDAALADEARALDILERLRPESGGGEQTRARFLADSLDEFQRMAGWKVERGDVAGAFAEAERARARSLLDQLATGGVDLRAGIAAEVREPLLRREAEQRALIAELSERLRQAGTAPSARKDARETRDRLQEAQREFERTYEETKNASALWREARGERLAAFETVRREVVPAHGLLLYYVVGRERTLLFAIPAAGAPEAYSLAVAPAQAAVLGVPPGPLTRELLAGVLDPSALAASADAPARGLLDRLASPRGGPLPVLERMLHALWQTLVPPALQDRTVHASEVVVVPDGLLNRLPFESLVLEPAAEGRDVRYWLDAGPVVRYGASANALLALARASARNPPDPRGGILSVSDPVYGAERAAATPSVPSLSGLDLARLPGTTRETAALRQLFGARVVPLAREEAREEAVVTALPRARYLHLATHGLVDESRGGLFATLALTVPPAGASGPGDDGQLQLHEIYELHLDADLAILSACESRSGNVVGGEGVFALSRAFLAAGARRVVASLWPADDAATGDLMEAFFREWADMERSGAAPDFARALASARRAVRGRAGWRHPFYWAGFVLEGPR